MEDHLGHPHHTADVVSTPLHPLSITLGLRGCGINAVHVDVVVQADEIPDDLQALLSNASLNLTYEELPVVGELSSPEGGEDRLRNGSIDALLRLQTNGTVLEYAVLYLSPSEQSL